MTDRDSESQMTTTTTFSFASGHILTLDKHQIEQIPYLYAMVSSADRFKSARNENGHFKLHPHIDYEHFPFVLHSLSFCSVRQLFTCLPKYIDVIPFIALLDFLGLGPQPDPPLNEVNSTFFSTIVYSPLLEKHLQIVRPCILQEIAVRFGIAMAKEEYDLTKCEVVDQIYWFLMFILSAHKWFGSRLRHHIYTIAEHCFSLFKPSLLKPLKKLKERANEERRRFVRITDGEDTGSDEENNCTLEQTLKLDLYRAVHYQWRFCTFAFALQQGGLGTRRNLLNRTYMYDQPLWFYYLCKPYEKEILEPVYRRVLEIAYEQLQTAISGTATGELNQRKNQCELMTTRFYAPLLYHSFKREILPKRIDDILTGELAQKEIRALISEDLRIFTPELERRHAELLEKIRRCKEDLEASRGNHSFGFLWFRPFDHYDLLRMQDKALSYELFLSKLHQNSNIVAEEMQQRVLDGLREVILKRFNMWGSTRRAINELCRRLNAFEESGKSLCVVPKTQHQRYQVPVHKPLLNQQFKHSTR